MALFGSKGLSDNEVALLSCDAFSLAGDLGKLEILNRQLKALEKLEELRQDAITKKQNLLQISSGLKVITMETSTGLI